MFYRSIVAIALCASAPAAAQNFPAKQVILDRLMIKTFNGIIVRTSDPVQTTTTLRDTISSSGGSTSRPPLTQILRIGNPTIYDIKNLSMDCVYLAQGGTRIAKHSQTFLKTFRAGWGVQVLMDAPVAAEADSVLCGPTDFDYIGVGVPSAPEPEVQVTSKPLADE